MTPTDVRAIARALVPIVRTLLAEAVAKLPPAAAGPAGPAGAAGRDGQPGVPGRDGAKGADGQDGAVDYGRLDPRLVAIDDRRVQLYFGDVMVRDGVITMPAAPETFKYRGVWTAGTTYPKECGVTWAGAIWIALMETTEKPGDGSKAWQLAVKRGRDGKDGDLGPPGPQGTKGDKGEPGRDYR